jgi:hypothetical protein
MNPIKNSALIFFGALFLWMSVGACSEARAQTVWVVCSFDTSSIQKQKDGREKFERRFYVTELISIQKEEFLALDGSGDRIEGACAEYLDKTVNKAATARGEKLDVGGTLKVLRNIELSGEDAGSPNPYNFAPKEEVEKKRAESIREAQDANRIIYNFNWDPSGANEEADLENETRRTSPKIGPAPKKSPARTGSG